MPQVIAQLNYLRISPRKVRAVTQLLRGLDVDLAQAQLKYVTRRSAKPLLKLLDSAVSNAQHNFGLDKSYLYIKEITVNEGMKLKRYKPKGFGLAMPIQKKTSRIKIVLDELSEDKRKRKEKILAKMPKVQVPMPKVSRISDREAVGKSKKEIKAEEKKEIKTEQRPKVKPSSRAQVKGKEIEKVSRPGRGSPEAARKGIFGGIKQLGRRFFRRKSI